MIDIDKCMDWWKDNRGNYRDNMGNRDGTDAEEELINSLYAEVLRLKHELVDATDNMNWLDELAERKEREVKRLREGIQDICNTGTDTNADWVSMALTRLKELIE